MGKPKAVLTDNGTQFTSKKWLETLSELGIKCKFTAIRNPCTNLAERINRQLGNMFRILVGTKHTNWARHLKLIEECLNQTYHETIQTTPHEAHWKQKPYRDWTRYIDGALIKDDEEVDYKKIYLRIKEKGEKRAKKLNEERNFVTYGVGDKVLVRTNPTSDLQNKIISKFCELYEGPYVVGEVIGRATYRLHDPIRHDVVRGIFNTRQLKPYFDSRQIKQ